MCFRRKEKAKRQMEVANKQESHDDSREKIVKKEETKSTPNIEKSALKEVKKTPKYHVSQNKNAKSPHFKEWGVKMEGSTKTIKFFNTQKEAIAYAEEIAANAGSSTVIHKVDGHIRKKDYSK